jgi:hypothetical protein
MVIRKKLLFLIVMALLFTGLCGMYLYKSNRHTIEWAGHAGDVQFRLGDSDLRWVFLPRTDTGEEMLKSFFAINTELRPQLVSKDRFGMKVIASSERAMNQSIYLDLLAWLDLKLAEVFSG